MAIYPREDPRTALPQLEKRIAELEEERADYVVEQGTNGNFTYRKWYSGIAELWGTTDTATYNLTSQYGGTYYGTYSLYIPTGIFASITSISINRANGGNGTVWVSPYSEYSSIVSNGAIGCYISNGTTWSGASLAFSIQVKGRWK